MSLDLKPGDCELFVPDMTPAFFNRVISDQAKRTLKLEVKIYFEIHEDSLETSVTSFDVENKGYSEVRL